MNGIIYNLNNIWDYLKKDYWDSEDLRFDFWYRLMRHQEIFNKVMELNNMIKSNNNGKDSTEELLEEIREKNKDYELELEWIE